MEIKNYLELLSHAQKANILQSNCEYVIFDVSVFNTGSVIRVELTDKRAILDEIKVFSYLPNGGKINVAGVALKRNNSAKYGFILLND